MNSCLLEGSISDQKTVQALAMELKQPLVEIACQAELASPESLKNINFRARQTLKLLDGFLLHAQTDYGQTVLPLQPATLGSAVYDAYAALLPEVKQQGAIIQTASLQRDRPVMVNKQAVSSILYIFGSLLLSTPTPQSHDGKKRQLLVRGFKSKNGQPTIGVFGNVELHQTDFEQALAMAGNVQMPWSDATHTFQASLLVADGLAKSIGAKLGVAKKGAMSGVFAELQPGQQLTLV